MLNGNVSDIQRQLQTCLDDLQQVAGLAAGRVLLVGGSTSEIAGERIGTATSVTLGKQVVETVLAFVAATGCDVAFQCCEHLNRSLVVSRALAVRQNLREVSAIPVPGAGGAMAAAAFFALPDACLVERIEADAGIDIGDTLIGMHLKSVVVPVRGTLKEIGAAHVVMATTRPPLVGGMRAVYDRAEAARRLLPQQPGS